MDATLWAAVAVQIGYPADLSLNQSYGYAFGRRHPLADKSARSGFGHPKDARRRCPRDGAHQKILRDHRITW